MPFCEAQETPAISPADAEWFERDVRPILADNCASCHSSGYGSVKGGLDLDSRESMLVGGDSGPAIAPGDLNGSLLVEAIRRESYEMPPEKPLSERERLVLEKWVAKGAPWPMTPDSDTGADWFEKRLDSHWAWHPVRRPSVPELANDDWSANAIDRFVLRRLRESGLEPAPDADPRTLSRRLNVDLTGLPPAFGAHAGRTTEEPYEQQVDRLLSSPQFGVHWGRHWLDLVRYAETMGHEFDYPIRHAWQYRETMIDTFNTDVTYDKIVEEHLAGDQLAHPRIHPLTGLNQSLTSTGFWWLGDSVHAPVDIVADLATRTDNQIDVVSKTFMGMTVACARCHDHKFDAIRTDDYYGLAGIAESSRRLHAITDPHDRITNHSRQIATEVAAVEADARANYLQAAEHSSMEEWLDRLVLALSENAKAEKPKRLATSHPLFLLTTSLDDNAKFGERVQRLSRRAEAAEQAYRIWESESPLIASFADGLPAGWRINAAEAVAEAARPTFECFAAEVPLPARQNAFSSQHLGKKQQLVLQSPNFELTHPAVCLKLRGKSAQSMVIIDNMFMTEFHNLLFKDTRKPIDQPNDADWVVHKGDLNKYVGHSVYLSLEDRGDDWFEIEEIRLANTPPPQRPHALTLQLGSQGIANWEELRRALAQRLTSAFRHVGESQTSNDLAIEITRGLVLLSAEHDVSLPPAFADMLQRSKRFGKLDRTTPAPTTVLSCTDGSPRDAGIAIRGNPHQRGDKVPRTCFIDAVGKTYPEVETSGRLELAKTLTSGHHPLASRVAVNRIWHHLMGRGLVSTPDNLGVLGGRPSHPELLDYLADQFVKHDWSIKWLVHEIVSSRTYRLSSIPTERQLTEDPDAALLSHRRVRRMSAESLRDTMLLTAGALDLRIGGPSVPIHLNSQMTGRGRPAKSGPLDGENRRSLFVEVRRNFLNPFLLAFDFPMPSTTVGDRTQSNVPAQALGLLNDPLVDELAQRWVANSPAETDARSRIANMIQTAFGRPASAQELQDCLDFVSDAPDGWRELAHVLLNSKEFLYVR